MLPISSHRDFLSKFDSVKEQSDLFLFLLFDSRPSHDLVERYAQENFEWLDQLAAASQMFGFVFNRKYQSEGEFSNPSLRVAESFGIKPNQLPGIILFSMYNDRIGVEKGIFLPLKASLFEERLEIVETVISDLFSIIQSERKKAESPECLLELIRKHTEGIERQQKIRPLIEYLSGFGVALSKLPIHIVETIGDSFAKEAGRKLAGGL